MAKRSVPAPQVEVGPGGRLVPLTAFDAAMVGQLPRGRVYNLTRAIGGRSSKQNRLYWSILQAVVDATAIVPTAGHLHEQLVRGCGYVCPVLNVLTGRYEESRDSTAFDAMPQDEMNLYFEAAVARLSEALGIDVTQLIEEGAAFSRTGANHAPAD